MITGTMKIEYTREIINGRDVVISVKVIPEYGDQKIQIERFTDDGLYRYYIVDKASGNTVYTLSRDDCLADAISMAVTCCAH